MATRQFDELNNLTSSKTTQKYAIPYEQYFGDMELTEEQIDKRINLAKSIEDVMLFLFTLIAVFQEYETLEISRQYIYDQAKERYASAISIYGTDDYIEQYVSDFAITTVDTTINHINDEYYQSGDRAQFIAENEANTILNHSEFEEAVSQGYAYKTWRTARDLKVRETHALLEGHTIPIEDAFWVGEYLMMYPKDTSLGAGAEEIVNCRCTIEYK